MEKMLRNVETEKKGLVDICGSILGWLRAVGALVAGHNIREEQLGRGYSLSLEALVFWITS